MGAKSCAKIGWIAQVTRTDQRMVGVKTFKSAFSFPLSVKNRTLAMMHFNPHCVSVSDSFVTDFFCSEKERYGPLVMKGAHLELVLTVATNLHIMAQR
jgi:hypothetical protein